MDARAASSRTTTDMYVHIYAHARLHPRCTVPGRQRLFTVEQLHLRKSEGFEFSVKRPLVRAFWHRPVGWRMETQHLEIALFTLIIFFTLVLDRSGCSAVVTGCAGWLGAAISLDCPPHAAAQTAAGQCARRRTSSPGGCCSCN